MTFDDHPADRLADLEKQLRDAHLVLACILQLAGGRITIPEDLLIQTERIKPLMQADTDAHGNVTYTLEPER